MGANRAVTAASAVTVNTTETAIVTVGPQTLAEAPGGAGAIVEAWIAFTGATSVTAVVLRIRAGAGTGGAVLAGPLTFPINGAVTQDEAIRYLDTTVSGAVTYTLTATATGAAGTATLATLSVEPVQTSL